MQVIVTYPGQVVSFKDPNDLTNACPSLSILFGDIWDDILTTEKSKFSLTPFRSDPFGVWTEGIIGASTPLWSDKDGIVGLFGVHQDK